MAYFDDIGTIVYTLDSQNVRLITNIFSSIRRKSNALQSDDLLFDNYTIADGDTPEIVADKIYGHTQYWWVVLVVANSISPNLWPKSSRYLDAYVVAKHQDPDQKGIRINSAGNQVSPRSRRTFVDDSGTVITYHDLGDGGGAEVGGVITGRGTFKSWREIETAANENLRLIPVLNPSYLSQFVSDFQLKMKA